MARDQDQPAVPGGDGDGDGRTMGSTEEWSAAGVTRKKLELLVAAGDLERVRRGFYATSELLAKAEDDPALGHAIKAAAVCTASNRGRQEGVASHHSAARMHGIELLYPPDEEVVTITVPPGRQTGRSKADVIVHAARLPAGHIAKLHDVRVTTVARTIADIARTSSFMAGVVVMESALRKKLTLKPEILGVLGDCERWPGTDLARRVVEFADWVPESVLESCSRVVFRERGLPEPQLQVPLLSKDGTFAARVDFCWPAFGTVAEADGMGKYESQDDLAAKYHRDSRLQDAGWEVAHFSWNELFADPAGVVARIRATFERGLEPGARRRRDRVPQPVTLTSRAIKASSAVPGAGPRARPAG